MGVGPAVTSIEPCRAHRRRCRWCAASRSSRSSSSSPGPVGGLWADQQVGASGQLALGVFTAGVLAALLALHPRTVRLQTLAVVGIATVGEVVGSIIWGVYTYRLDNLPAFVPPGHGLVYLCGFSLATLAARRPSVAPRRGDRRRLALGDSRRHRASCDRSVGRDRLHLPRPRAPEDAPAGLRGRLPRRRGARDLRHGDRDLDLAGSRSRPRHPARKPAERRRERLRRLRRAGDRARRPPRACRGDASVEESAKRGRVHDGARADQLAGGVDLVPDVPEQEPARSSVCRRRRRRRPSDSARPTPRPGRGASRRRRPPRTRGRRGRSRRTGRWSYGVPAPAMFAPTTRPCVFAWSSCSTRRVPPSAGTGKRATSPAANTSSRPPACPYSSTRTPSSTSRPAASASSVAGTIPRPATTASASIVVPLSVSTGVARGFLDELPGEHGHALLAVVVVHELRQLGRERASRRCPRRGRAIVTSQPFIARAAAISEPMKPPPTTATRTPSPASSRRCR